jgi:exodeoxyribonuclease VII large subunit
VVESEARFRERVSALDSGLIRGIRQRIDFIRSSLRQNTRLLADPRGMLGHFAQRVDELAGRLATGLKQSLRRDRALLASLTAGLDHLNPLGILSRGYSITKKLPAGLILKDAAEVKYGDLLSTRLHNGEIVSRVETAAAPPRRSSRS